MNFSRSVFRRFAIVISSNMMMRLLIFWLPPIFASAMMRLAIRSNPVEYCGINPFPDGFGAYCLGDPILFATFENREIVHRE